MPTEAVLSLIRDRSEAKASSIENLTVTRLVNERNLNDMIGQNEP